MEWLDFVTILKRAHQSVHADTRRHVDEIVVGEVSSIKRLDYCVHFLVRLNAFDGPPRRVDVADEPAFSGAQRCGLEGRRRPSQAAAAASARNGDPGEYGRAAERNEDGLEGTSFDDARLVLG